MRIRDWSSDVCSSDLAKTWGTVRDLARIVPPPVPLPWLFRRLEAAAYIGLSMRARPLRPQIQTPSKVWVAGPVQPLEQFPRPRVFILRNLPVPLECGPPPRYIRVSAGWKRLIFWPFMLEIGRAHV